MAKPLAHVDTETREPFIIIDGKKYPLSGAFKPPSFSLSANYSNNWNGSFTVQAPYKAPEGFTFQLFTLRSTGFTHVSTNDYNPGTGVIYARVYQAGSNAAGNLSLVGWRLVSLSEDPNRLN